MGLRIEGFMRSLYYFAGVVALAAVGTSLLAGQVGGETSDGSAQSEDHATANADSTRESDGMEYATFGAGCFWGVDAAFRQTEGVTATAVGYAGGTIEHPTYHDVCSGTTGHAEVVQVCYDPDRVSYEKLLDIFWNEHDPTQVNRQGPDIGEQYRSVIFYHSDAQRLSAEKSKEALDKSGTHRRPIATSIEPAPTFYRAEEYHQRYLEKRGLSTCKIK